MQETLNRHGLPIIGIPQRLRRHADAAEKQRVLNTRSEEIMRESARHFEARKQSTIHRRPYAANNEGVTR